MLLTHVHESLVTPHTSFTPAVGDVPATADGHCTDEQRRVIASVRAACGSSPGQVASGQPTGEPRPQLCGVACARALRWVRHGSCRSLACTPNSSCVT